jgi:hypothetical protein
MQQQHPYSPHRKSRVGKRQKPPPSHFVLNNNNFHTVENVLIHRTASSKTTIVAPVQKIHAFASKEFSFYISGWSVWVGERTLISFRNYRTYLLRYARWGGMLNVILSLEDVVKEKKNNTP